MRHYALFLSTIFLVACKPEVSSISPEQGAFDAETKVEIVGDGFVADGLSVTFGGLVARVESATDTRIEAYAPIQDAPGPVVVKVSNEDGVSDQEPIFSYTSRPPVIKSFDPPSAPSNVRTVMCVHGENLESNDLKLFVGTSEARILDRSANSIIALVDPQRANGELRAESSHGQGASQDPFVVDGEADLSGGDLVLLKRSGQERDAPPSARALEDAVRASVSIKDAILVDANACGLRLGRALPNLPVFQILDVERDLRARLASDARIETITPNGVAFKQTNESLKVINRDQVERRANQRPTEFGAGTAVAVIDSGVDYRKSPYSCAAPGGSCRVAFAADFGPDDGEPDDDGHGTNVAAIVTAVAPKADILALDVFGGGGASTVNILSAIDWSIQNQGTYNIVAINMSLGETIKRPIGDCISNDPYGLAAERARLAGINVIASSGNNGWTDGMPRPACSPAVISVGAVYDADIGGSSYPDANCTDPQSDVDQVACFSNHAHWLSLLAPGASISAGGLDASGTSQAAPHVAGAVATLASLYPDLTPKERRMRLETSSTPVTDLRVGNATGNTKPRLDLLAAIQGAEGRPLPMVPEGEAWPVKASLRGSYAAVADVPEFDRSNNGTLTDRSSGIGWWRELGPEPPVFLQRAGYRCTRYGPNFASPISILRLPTRAEALSVLDFTRMDAFVDPSLGNDMSREFWTVSPENRGPRINSQWSVNYEIGNSTGVGSATSLGSSTKLRHRCIFDRYRVTDPPSPRYVKTGSVVEDRATGLFWLSEPLKDDQGRVANYSYNDAAAACSTRTDGMKQWRVPTVKELLSVMSYGNAPMDSSVFATHGRLISSTPELRRNPGSPTVRFLGVDDKSGWIEDNTQSGAVRCVVQNAPMASESRHLAGSVFIRTATDIQALKAGQFTSADNIYIETSDTVRSVVLPGLKTVTGNLFISGNTEATLVWLPDLERVGGGFEVTGNAKLQMLSAPRLARVDGNLLVSGSDTLIGFDDFNGVSSPVYLPALKVVGGDMRMTRNTWRPMLQVFFNNLETIGGQADFSDNRGLLFLGFVGLTSIGKECSNGSAPFCGNLFIERNAGFSGIRMIRLEEIARGLLIRDNPDLNTVWLNSISPDAFTRIRGEVDITNNRDYCASRFNGFILRWPLNAFPAKVSIRNNSPLASCASQCSRFPPNNATDCPIFTGP